MRFFGVAPSAFGATQFDSAELFDGMHKYPSAKLNVSFSEIVTLIADTLSPHRSAIECHGMRLEDFAKLVEITAEGIK